MRRPLPHGPLAEIITTFLIEKRALGYRYIEQERLLRRLDRFLLEREIATPELPRDLVRQWLAKTPHERALTQASRASATLRLGGDPQRVGRQPDVRDRHGPDGRQGL